MEFYSMADLQTKPYLFRPDTSEAQVLTTQLRYSIFVKTKHKRRLISDSLKIVQHICKYEGLVSLSGLRFLLVGL